METIKFDADSNLLYIEDTDGESVTLSLDSQEAFDRISKLWLRCGWNTKYVYTFTWMGRPIIQLPEDLLRLQEVIYQLKPDVIIETGVAHGGGLVFYATLCKAMNKGKVIGIDIEIRSHNLEAIQNHELSDLITLYEGSSTDSEVYNQVAKSIKPNETVLVILDSNHSKAHVFKELKMYSKLVTVNSYIVATDGIMKDLKNAPRSKEDWETNNPYQAAMEFLLDTDAFVLERPSWKFNESTVLSESSTITYWPGAWIKRLY